MSEKNELKPCPFCGGEAHSYDDYMGFCHVQCEECGNGTLKCTTASEARALWNRRVPTTHINNTGHITINMGKGNK